MGKSVHVYYNNLPTHERVGARKKIAVNKNQGVELKDENIV